MSGMPHAKASASGHRAMKNYVGLGRTAIQSHYRKLVDNLAPGAERPPLSAFDDNAVFQWIKNWVVATFKTDVESIFVPADRKHSFDPYPAQGERGHYDLSGLLASDGSIRIALAGDWATGTDVSQTIADNLVSGDPKAELTIHLGDIYYVGEEDEVKENCLGQDTPLYKGVFWRRGTKGSFALNGNHEMYSGGNAYFKDFLPTLGIPTSADGQQLRSYFCLETPVWRILAIDTGYNADTLLGNCKLEGALLDWLRKVIDPVQNRKPTVLLSHHQWFSSFGDDGYEDPANQMAEFLRGQEIVWLWGHEHRLAIYKKYKGENGITAYARCMGHGGMPVLTGGPVPGAVQQVEYFDPRTHALEDGTIVGENGSVNMVIRDSALTLEYFDHDRKSLLKETFQPGGAGGWDGTLTRTISSDPHILKHA